MLKMLFLSKYSKTVNCLILQLQLRGKSRFSIFPPKKFYNINYRSTTIFNLLKIAAKTGHDFFFKFIFSFSIFDTGWSGCGWTLRSPETLIDNWHGHGRAPITLYPKLFTTTMTTTATITMLSMCVCLSVLLLVTPFSLSLFAEWNCHT